MCFFPWGSCFQLYLGNPKHLSKVVCSSALSPLHLQKKCSQCRSLLGHMLGCGLLLWWQVGAVLQLFYVLSNCNLCIVDGVLRIFCNNYSGLIASFFPSHSVISSLAMCILHFQLFHTHCTLESIVMLPYCFFDWAILIPLPFNLASSWIFTWFVMVWCRYMWTWVENCLELTLLSFFLLRPPALTLPYAHLFSNPDISWLNFLWIVCSQLTLLQL